METCRATGGEPLHTRQGDAFEKTMAPSHFPETPWTIREPTKMELGKARERPRVFFEALNRALRTPTQAWKPVELRGTSRFTLDWKTPTVASGSQVHPKPIHPKHKSTLSINRP